MKRIKIEFPVTILTAIVVLGVTFSGYLVYQSLSQIVDSIHREARPDFKLLQIKAIAADLSEVESTVRLYSVTRDEKYFHPYKQINQSVQKKLTNLEDYAQTSEKQKMQIDSIRQLTNAKLAVWKEILVLHHAREDAHESFTELYTKIDSAKTEPDTILVEVEAPEKKRGLLKRIFGGKKKDPEIIEQIQIQPVDSNTIDKDSIKQEIAQIENRIKTTNQTISVQEKALLEENIILSELLKTLITKLETDERKKLLEKTQEADRLAAITYKRLALFTLGSVILLLLVLFLFYRYLNKSRIHQNLLHKAKIDAEKLARAKEVFVATVSHEMRTPINAIYGLTEQLIKKTDNNKHKKDLEIIYTSTEHLISLVEDTLDFSKIESQKLKLAKDDFSLSKLLADVIVLNKGKAKSKKLQLKLDTDDLEPIVLRGDVFRLKQILINLVTNAIKFTDQGSVTLKVSAKENKWRKIWVSIQVIDTGIGISKENHSLIFDDFVQLETDLTRKQGGAGLGLAIVKKLIDVQKGKISIDSELNKGTTISLEIPYDIGDPSKIKQAEQETLTIPDHFSSLSILIVDDEEFNRYLLRSILEKWNINVTECSDGQQAVDLYKKEHFDLVFMDIRMPVLNGFEAAKQIVQQNNTAKIIALTATNKPDDIEKCKQAGMQQFLPKPFTEKELLVSLSSASEPQKTQDEMHKKVEAKPQIDLSELKRMANGNMTFVNEMLEIFIRSSNSGLSEMKKNIVLKNWNMVREYAHKMAAPAKHIKALSLYSKIKEIEHEARLGENEQKIIKLSTEIEYEVETTNRYLRSILEDQ